MTDQERLNKIKELIAERDKYIVDGEVTSYPEHDSILFRINDDGHIDWLVERVQELEKLSTNLNHELFSARTERDKLREEVKVLKKSVDFLEKQRERMGGL